jgi:hypothetical protein
MIRRYQGHGASRILQREHVLSESLDAVDAGDAVDTPRLKQAHHAAAVPSLPSAELERTDRARKVSSARSLNGYPSVLQRFAVRPLCEFSVFRSILLSADDNFQKFLPQTQ